LAAQSRAAYLDVGRSEDALIFVRRVRQHVAEAIEQCLREHFEEQSSKVPFPILANYLAGAQISLITWWLESHAAFTAQQIAVSYQMLQRAAIQDALRLPNTHASVSASNVPESV
jgi:hypothetical protein